MRATTRTRRRSWRREFRANANVEVGRFKGLGEMMPAQLKETTMDPKKRTILKVMLVPDDRADTQRSVERLMGTKAEVAVRVHPGARGVREYRRARRVRARIDAL